jgi:hypothetical protein
MERGRGGDHVRVGFATSPWAKSRNSIQTHPSPRGYDLNSNRYIRPIQSYSLLDISRHWYLAFTLMLNSCFTLAVSALNQSTG